MLQWKYTISSYMQMPFTKQKMPRCPCPFQTKHTGLLRANPGNMKSPRRLTICRVVRFEQVVLCFTREVHNIDSRRVRECSSKAKNRLVLHRGIYLQKLRHVCKEIISDMFTLHNNDKYLVYGNTKCILLAWQIMFKCSVL